MMVGSFKANRIGFHDMHGEVHDWCKDKACDNIVQPHPGDGVREPKPEPQRVNWRAGFGSNATHARSAARTLSVPDFRAYDLRVRPARVLTH